MKGDVMDGTCSIQDRATVLQSENLNGSVGGRIILKLILCKQDVIFWVDYTRSEQDCLVGSYKYFNKHFYFINIEQFFESDELLADSQDAIFSIELALLYTWVCIHVFFCTLQLVASGQTIVDGIYEFLVCDNAE